MIKPYHTLLTASSQEDLRRRPSNKLCVGVRLSPVCSYHKQQTHRTEYKAILPDCGGSSCIAVTYLEAGAALFLYTVILGSSHRCTTGRSRSGPPMSTT